MSCESNAQMNMIVYWLHLNVKIFKDMQIFRNLLVLILLKKWFLSVAVRSEEDRVNPNCYFCIYSFLLWHWRYVFPISHPRYSWWYL